MRFDIYRRLQIEVRREGNAWAVYQWVPGKRVPCDDVVISASVTIEEIPTYLDDIYHELAGPGDEVRVIET